MNCTFCRHEAPTTPAGRVYTVSTATSGIEVVCDLACASGRADEVGAFGYVVTKFHPDDLD